MTAPAWMNGVSLGTIVVTLFVLLTLAGLLWAILRPAVRALRRTDKTVQQLSEDWFGQEGRPGFPAVPGVPQRLLDVEKTLSALRPIVERIEREMNPNGGGSLRDQITSMRSKVDPMQNDINKIQAEMGSLTRALDNARTLRALIANTEQGIADDDRRAG